VRVSECASPPPISAIAPLVGKTSIAISKRLHVYVQDGHQDLTLTGNRELDECLHLNVNVRLVEAMFDPGAIETSICARHMVAAWPQLETSRNGKWSSTRRVRFLLFCLFVVYPHLVPFEYTWPVMPSMVKNCWNEMWGGCASRNAA
jgi:hypothetical protein